MSAGGGAVFPDDWVRLRDLGTPGVAALPSGRRMLVGEQDAGWVTLELLGGQVGDQHGASLADARRSAAVDIPRYGRRAWSSRPTHRRSRSGG